MLKVGVRGSPAVIVTCSRDTYMYKARPALFGREEGVEGGGGDKGGRRNHLFFSSTLPLFVPMSLLTSEAGEHASLAHACGCLCLLCGFFDRA